jgi:hypothetical protein
MGCGCYDTVAAEDGAIGQTVSTICPDRHDVGAEDGA